ADRCYIQTEPLPASRRPSRGAVNPFILLPKSSAATRRRNRRKRWIVRDIAPRSRRCCSSPRPPRPISRLSRSTITPSTSTASPPKVVQQVTAGKGANEVSVSPDGTLALVANRAEGTVSVFTVKDKRLSEAGKVDLGNPKSLPSSVKFLPDGKTALVTRFGDNTIGVLKIDGSKVTLDKASMTPGVNPYTLDINRDGTLGVVGNMGGGGNGEIGSVALIDLTPGLFRTVHILAVPSSPEGVKFSPDGKFVASASVDGSTRPADSPIYHKEGQLWMLAVIDKKLK